MSALPAPVPVSGEVVARAGEIALTSAEFARIAELIHEWAGISLPPAKAQLVCSRLASRLRACRLATFAPYVARVLADTAERDRFLVALTTNKTDFFREEHHFEVLERQVLAPRVATGKRTPLRFWSAASSSGEEVYSLMIKVFETLPHPETWDVRALATDINVDMVEATARATYSAERVRELSAARLARFFEPSGPSTHRVTGALRSRVVAKALNLNKPPWAIKGYFDAIFCRNVLIYFDRDTSARVVTSLLSHLRPGGLLVLGHSESQAGSREDLRPLGRSAFVYVKREAPHA